MFIVFMIVNALSQMLLSAQELLMIDLQAGNKQSILLLYFYSVFLLHRRIPGDAIRRSRPG